MGELLLGDGRGWCILNTRCLRKASIQIDRVADLVRSELSLLALLKVACFELWLLLHIASTLRDRLGTCVRRLLGNRVLIHVKLDRGFLRLALNLMAETEISQAKSVDTVILGLTLLWLEA